MERRARKLARALHVIASMDPNEALRIIDLALAQCADGLCEADDVADAMDNLHHWLQAGGFEPSWARYPNAARAYRAHMTRERELTHRRRERNGY